MIEYVVYDMGEIHKGDTQGTKQRKEFLNLPEEAGERITKKRPRGNH